jgi:hypothetical protein
MPAGRDRGYPGWGMLQRADFLDQFDPRQPASP